MTDAPDYIDPIVGWRAWVLRDSTDGPELMSFNGTPWPVFERMEAVCGRRHAVPELSCSCGIYAAASRRQLQELGYPRYDLERSQERVIVSGEVKLWGDVIPGTQGWRAQYAYPSRLFVPFECWRWAADLRDCYGVPVKLANTFRLTEA